MPYLFLLAVQSVFAQAPPQETDTLTLRHPYAVLVTTHQVSGVYPPKITIAVANLAKDTIIYRESDSFKPAFVVGLSHFELGKKSAALIEAKMHTSPQHTETSLLILIPESNDRVYRTHLNTQGHFLLLDLDSDSAQELLLTTHLHSRINVQGCAGKLAPNPHFEGSLLPEIYKLQTDSLVKIDDSDRLKKLYYPQYIRKLEEKFSTEKARYISHYKDYSRPKALTLLDYAQYFYLCTRTIKKKKHALNFLQKHDKRLMYICRDVPGKSFTIDTNLSHFFRQFGKNVVLAQEEIEKNIKASVH